MKLKKWFAVLTMAACLPLTAIALPIPAEPYDASVSGDELNLFEIYNEVYGTALTSNTDLEAFAISPDDLFETLYGASLDAVARYAAFGQSVGYYNGDGDSAPVEVTGLNLNATAHLVIPPGVFGLYNQIDGGGSPRWYSDPLLNAGFEDHLVAYYGQNNDIFVAFEDREFTSPLADFDYNDLVLTLSQNAIVPEPASFLLVGIGLAGMIFRRYQK